MISNIHIKTPPINKLNKRAKKSHQSLLPPIQWTSAIDTARHADNVSQIPLTIWSKKCSENLVMLRQEFKCQLPSQWTIKYSSQWLLHFRQSPREWEECHLSQFSNSASSKRLGSRCLYQEATSSWSRSMVKQLGYCTEFTPDYTFCMVPKERQVFWITAFNRISSYQ